MEKIKIQKKQGSVVEILKHEILLGNIPSGTEMTQNELATSLGVSRMPVREALILLEYQGLIDRLPNNHVRVAQLSEEYFRKIFELCIHIEKDAILYVLDTAEDDIILPTEEMNFHKFLYEKYPYSFQKKMLETVIEIYVSFAVNSFSYNKANGAMLLEAVKDFQKGREGDLLEVLRKYYKEILSTIMKERV
ncbi:GntR family transcriptional regulator [Anaerostipes sp. MSJ-23]|uniref:GntR family transcriptional regulator n=1 Tax=Anaerostipes sp. MSJ-23 TaxID=2841520 RepID=UPI00209CB140|nr:GntR family transcriptional regulator [Anaerostipes sp. MSJ-23]